jgi:hypothetical protein
MSAHRRRILVFAAAAAVPLAIALVFPSPTDRPIIPESLMLMTVVAVTFAGGLSAGLLAAASSTISIWFFNLPNAQSFTFASTEDRVVVITVAVVSVSLATLVDWLRRRERRVTVRTTELEAQRESDKQTIDVLQHAVLPATPPTVPGVSIDCAYTVGGGPASPVGGDWFSIIPMDDGRLGVAVGDVVGHGLEAVAAMAEYRFTLRALAASGEPPHVVLNRLAEQSRHFGRTQAFTTCVYGVIDPNAATWTFASAGHPPPLCVRDGAFESLEARGGPPIGALRNGIPSYASTEHALKVGDMIVLYTDGLVERRGELIDIGIRRLGDRAARIRADVRHTGQPVIDDLVGDMPADDAALVLVHFDRAVPQRRPNEGK